MGVNDVSLQAKIYELIRDLKDPMMRIDVASSITFLADVYRLGRASEEDIYNDLIDVCMAVFKNTMPDAAEDELRRMAEEKAKEFLDIIRITGTARRISRKYGLTF